MPQVRKPEQVAEPDTVGHKITQPHLMRRRVLNRRDNATELLHLRGGDQARANHGLTCGCKLPSVSALEVVDLAIQASHLHTPAASAHIGAGQHVAACSVSSEITQE